MLQLDQLYTQKISEKLNRYINEFFNRVMVNNLILGRILAPFVIFSKCVLHTLAILINTFEYALRGFISLFSPQGSTKEYFSTIGSFLVINTVNALTVIPDIFIRTYYTIKDSKIDPIHSKHTLFYRIMSLI